MLSQKRIQTSRKQQKIHINHITNHLTILIIHNNQQQQQQE
jgi:hypothetical protein